ncbi:MAG: RNA polymerase factor sigma-54 [Pseudomonadota bacterium]
MKPSLQLRISQQLTLTPQLQQAIRLLQLSTLDIHQEVAQMLEDNPLLEASEDVSTSAVSPDADNGDKNNDDSANNSDDSQDTIDFDEVDWSSSLGGSHSGDDDEDGDNFPEQPSGQISLREHLYKQLSTSPLVGQDRKMIGMLIDALDENGYLVQDLTELVELLPEELNISLDDLETALVQLQHLDQIGIGARDLKECLLLQLKVLPADTPQLPLAIDLVSNYLDALAAHDFAKLKRQLHCSDDELRAAQSLITSLNPRPGAEFNQGTADYLIPDVIVEKHKDKWRARLNEEALPKLRVNQIYSKILQQRGAGSSSQLASQLQEAKWMIKNLQQRFDTILRIAQVIVERQEQFFEHGEIGMRPMVLREVSEALNLHESTISRGTTQKFMMTPRGIYEFKHFFGSGLATESGGICSSTAIRELIKQFVSEEDTRKPLTDSRMSEMLAQQGIVVARRTVAKYRDALNILPVNLRKSL